MNKKSFIEKLQNANFGKKGIYLGIATLVAIIVIKIFVVPLLQPYYNSPFWKNFQFAISLLESIAICNVIAFFVCIVFLKNGVGGKIIYAMQLQDTNYFKDKWILWWLRSLIWCFIALGFTTVIQQAFFKPWSSFVYLCIFIAIPFFIMPKMKKMQQNRFQ